MLARQPDFGPALAARGKLALQAGQYAEAEVWLRRAERAHPWDATLLPALQKCLTQSGQTDKARGLDAAVKQARRISERLEHLVTEDIQKNPYNADAQYEAGTILLRMAHREQGVRPAAERHPARPAAPQGARQRWPTSTGAPARP